MLLSGSTPSSSLGSIKSSGVPGITCTLFTTITCRTRPAKVASIAVSVFIDPDLAQLDALAGLGAEQIPGFEIYTDASHQTAICFRMGNLFETKLGDLDQAVESYEKALKLLEKIIAKYPKTAAAAQAEALSRS